MISSGLQRFLSAGTKFIASALVVGAAILILAVADGGALGLSGAIGYLIIVLPLLIPGGAAAAVVIAVVNRFSCASPRACLLLFVVRAGFSGVTAVTVTVAVLAALTWLTRLPPDARPTPGPPIDPLPGTLLVIGWSFASAVIASLPIQRR